MPKPVKQSVKSPKNGNGRTGIPMPAVIKRIRPIAFDPEDGIKILLYGRSGSGKTTLWSTFPAPILSMICSGGLESGELRSIDTEENADRVKCVTLHESSELNDLVSFVSETRSYKTIVLDHASGFQDMVLMEVLGLDEIPAQKTWGLADQREWGQVAVQMKERLRAMFNLKCNVVVIAQERVFDQDAQGGISQPFIGPATTPSVAQWLNQAADYVCQTFIRPKTERKATKIGGKTTYKQIPVKDEKGNEVKEYCLRTAPHEAYNTKFRVPKGTPLPAEIVDPDYDKIIGLIRGVKRK